MKHVLSNSIITRGEYLNGMDIYSRIPEGTLSKFRLHRLLINQVYHIQNNHLLDYYIVTHQGQDRETLLRRISLFLSFLGWKGVGIRGDLPSYSQLPLLLRKLIT